MNTSKAVTIQCTRLLLSQHNNIPRWISRWCALINSGRYSCKIADISVTNMAETIVAF